MKKRVFGLQCIGSKISDMYTCDMLLKNLNVFKEIHCKRSDFPDGKDYMKTYNKRSSYYTSVMFKGFHWLLSIFSML